MTSFPDHPEEKRREKRGENKNDISSVKCPAIGRSL
jgi:hypothetical protein